MNFLAICQQVNTITGVQGTILSVATVTGYQATIVQYVRNAYEDIQKFRTTWNFLKTVASIPLTSAASSYTSVSAVGKWDMAHIRYDSKPLRVISYDTYIESKISENTPGIPAVVAVDPATKYLYFNPLDGDYTILASYWQVPESLATNTSIPILPIDYHQLIVYRAVADFAAFIGNGNLYQLYTQKADTMLGELLRTNNPAKRVRLRRAT